MLPFWKQDFLGDVHLDGTAGPWHDLAGWYGDHWNNFKGSLILSVFQDYIPPQVLCYELVSVYCENIHPLYSIFDEVEFYDYYCPGWNEISFLAVFSLLELYASNF